MANPDFNFYFTERWMGNDQIFPHKTGVVGVWASNFLAWKNLLESDYDAVIIFEDDAEMKDNFFEMFYKIYIVKYLEFQIKLNFFVI